MIINQNSLKNNLENNGFIFIPKLLSENEVKNISKYVIENSNDKNETFTIALFNKKSGKLDKIHRDSINIINQIDNISNLTKSMKLVGDSSTISRIDAYSSYLSSEPVLPWHNDRAFSGDKVIHNKVQNRLFSFKAFVYLTDSIKSNGSLAYLPKSHLISSALRSLIRKNIIPYEPFWSLKDFFDLVNRKKVIEALLDLNKFSISTLDQFKRDVEFILLNPTTTKFDISGSKGDCILFDERGFHRGGRPAISNRRVLRIFYLNGAGKYENEPITDYGKIMKDKSIGEFKSKI